MIKSVNQSSSIVPSSFILDYGSKNSSIPQKFFKYCMSFLFTLPYEKRIFHKMLSSHGLRIADPYLKEEEEILNDILKTKDIETIVVIGAGPLRYLNLANNKNYIAIDKFLNSFLNNDLKFLMKEKKNITLISKAFEEVNMKDLPKKNCLYIFTFNVVSYIDNFLLIINKMANKDNIFFISGWNDKRFALKSTYLRYVYENSSYIRSPSSFIDPHKMDFSNIKKIKGIEKYEKIFTKFLILTT